MAVSALANLPLDAVYTYADYLGWQFQERVELIKGKLFKMSPAPSRRHQEVSLRLSAIFYQKIAKEEGCKVYAAPFDVRFPKDQNSKGASEIYTVVQPDLSVICDPAKLDDRGCIGAPDLIVEILSKGSSKKEISTKFDLYQEYGVKEYWVIFPYEEVLQQFVLTEGVYQLRKMYANDDTVKANVFPDLEVNLTQLFAE